MAAMRRVGAFPMFGISRFTCRVNRFFTRSSLRSSASEVGNDFPEHDRRESSLRKEDHQRSGDDSKSTLEAGHEIPPSENLNLYEYVKKLEGTLALGSGTILKSCSTLSTTHVRNKKLNVSASLKPESPGILGLTANVLEERLFFLAQLGITGRDALIIALEFPAILSWDSPSFATMLKVLKDLNCDMVKLVCKTPYVFSLEYGRATENIHKLETAGVPKDTIGKLVSENPLILSFPLRDDSLEIITLFLDFHNSIECNGDDEKDANKEKAIISIISFLLQSSNKFKEQIILSQENFKQVVGFLHEKQVSPLIIAAKNARIFNTDIGTLISAVEFFKSKPLLLEMEAIQHLLVTRPEFFVNFDLKAMTSRIQLISDLVQSQAVLCDLVQNKYLFHNDDAAIEDIIQWFKSKGVDDEGIANLMYSLKFFSLNKHHLNNRLKYLFSVEGVTVEDIKKYPACLLRPLSHLKARVEFLKANKPDVLNESNLCHIMTFQDEHFAVEICKSTLENFTQFAQSPTKDEA